MSDLAITTCSGLRELRQRLSTFGAGGFLGFNSRFMDNDNALAVLKAKERSDGKSY